MAAAAPAAASGALISVVHGAIARRTSGRGAAGEPTRFAAPSVRRIVLITGDVVRLTTAPDGRQQAAVAHHATTGAGAQFQTFNRGSDLYVVRRGCAGQRGPNDLVSAYKLPTSRGGGQTVTSSTPTATHKLR